MDDMDEIRKVQLADDEPPVITMQDENGNDTDFEFLDLIDYNGGVYALVIPADDGEGNVLILRETSGSPDDEEQSFEVEDDDDTLQAVFDIFKKNHADDFDFD